MILTEAVHARLEVLRGTATAKQAVIKVHVPISGAYFTLRDAATESLIGRYDSTEALRDALQALPADPAHPDRVAARAAREADLIRFAYASAQPQGDCDPAA